MNFHQDLFHHLKKIVSSRFFYLDDVPHQWQRLFHLNSWRIKIVWNVATLSQIVDNTTKAYISIDHWIALKIYVFKYSECKNFYFFTRIWRF